MIWTDEPAKTMKPEMTEPKPLIEEMANELDVLTTDHVIGELPTSEEIAKALARVVLARMRDDGRFGFGHYLDTFAREHGLEDEG